MRVKLFDYLLIYYYVCVVNCTIVNCTIDK